MRQAELLKIIQELKNKLKNDPIVQEMFEHHNVDISELDTIPICFSDLDVSARTEHGIIYLNFSLLHGNSLNESAHYLVHEIDHYLQQTTGAGPTEGSTDDTYLDNEFEQEGFNFQTKFLSEHEGDDVAEGYIEKVLDHHDIDSEKERKKRKKELLELANNMNKCKVAAKQLEFEIFNPPIKKSKEELMQEFEEKINNPRRKSHIHSLTPGERENRLKALKNIIQKIEKNID